MRSPAAIMRWAALPAWIGLPLFCALCPATGPGALRAESARPNVILIVADDLGYGDLSCYGSTRIKTPRLDRMAEEGLRLTAFYAGASVCTPSRMALLSGSYPTRLGWRGGVLGYGMPADSGLSPDAVSLAEVFREAGYRTAISGKWHVGGGPMLPMHRGFDENFYILLSNNQTDKLWRDGEVAFDPFDNSRLTELFTQEAIRFITAESERPFFLYLPYTAPHFPADAHPEWENHSANGAYGDVVEELDSRIGEILDALKEHNLDDDTLVVFTSDNGPEPGQRRFASAAPYGGLKWSAREGSVRVPCIVRRPGVVKPGGESDALISAIDLLPTLAEACGIEVNLPDRHRRLDGVSVWGTLLGTAREHARKDLLYWDGRGTAKAIRVGEWKLYFGHEEGVPGTEQGMALFHLKDDPAESENLGDRHPRKVQAMADRAKALLQEIHENSLPSGVAGRAAPEKPEKKWGKWLVE